MQDKLGFIGVFLVAIVLPIGWGVSLIVEGSTLGGLALFGFGFFVAIKMFSD